MGELSGKVAIVTGASKGIGAAIARAFAEAGAAVAVNYASNRADANRVVEELEAGPTPQAPQLEANLLLRKCVLDPNPSAVDEGVESPIVQEAFVEQRRKRRAAELDGAGRAKIAHHFGLVVAAHRVDTAGAELI